MDDFFKEVLFEYLDFSHIICVLIIIFSLCLFIRIIFDDNIRNNDSFFTLFFSLIFITTFSTFQLMILMSNVMEEVFIRKNGIISNVEKDLKKDFLNNKPVYYIVVSAHIKKGDVLFKYKDYSIERKYMVDENKYNNAKNNIGINIMYFSNNSDY